MRRPRVTVDQMCALWRTVLDVDDVQPSSNLIDLGVRSVDIVRLVDALRDAEITVSLAAVFRNPTPERLTAATVDGRPPAETDDGRPQPAQAVLERPSVLQLTRIVVADGRVTQPDFPPVTAYFSVRGALHRDALAWSLVQVARRHEALRSRFLLVDGEPMVDYRPADEARWPLTQVDGRGLGRDAVRDRVRAAAARPFALADEPPVRALVVDRDLDDDEHLLLLVVDHLVSDGLSRVVILEDLAHFWNAWHADASEPLPPVAAQYRDFARLHRAWLDTHEGRRARAWWGRELRRYPAVPVLPPPADPQARSSGRIDRAAVISRRVEPGVWSDVLAVTGSPDSVMTYALWLAGFARVLVESFAVEQLGVVVSTGGRDIPGTERTVGFFAEALVVNLDASPLRSASAVDYVRERLADCIGNRGVPYLAVGDEDARSARERWTTQPTAYFDTNLAAGSPTPDFAHLTLQERDVLAYHERMAFPGIALFVQRNDHDTVDLVGRYSEGAYRAHWIERMLAAVGACAARLCRDA